MTTHGIGEISRTRKLIFSAILVLMVGIAPFTLLEIGVRVAGMRVADDPYLQFGRVDSFFEINKIEGREYYKVIGRDIYRERNIVFARNKDPGTFRIFCLGSSASAGWPHPGQEIYSAYLEEALRRAYPNRKIEVINVSAHGYPAYRTRMIFQDVIDFQPDLFVVYAGNNEFLEKRIYHKTSWWESLANHSKVYRVLRGSRWARRWFPQNTLQANEQDHISYERWSRLEQLALALRRDPTQYEWVKKHYVYSIESMLRGARNRGVPVVLATVPVNLRDWQPNVSYHELQGADLQEWEELYRGGRAALLRGNIDTAVTELREAAARSPLHGATNFHLARALDRKEQFAEASEYFSRARDLDYNPFRATSDFNSALRELAGRYDNVQLADLAGAFGSANPRAPGFDLFLDYVHPTKEGNLIVAKTVFDAIVGRKFVSTGPPATGFLHEPRPFYPDGRPYDDAKDFNMQAIMLSRYVVMHQDESAAAKIKYLLDTRGALDALPQDQVAFIRDAAEVYPQRVELERRELLNGRIDPTERARQQASLSAFHRSHFPGYEEFVKEKNQN